MGGPGTGANGRDIRDLLRFLGQTLPRQALLMLNLMLAMAATEWIGLMLLVPLLGVVGLEVGQGTVGRIGRLISDVFGTFGSRPALPLVLAGYVLVVSGRALLQRCRRREPQFPSPSRKWRPTKGIFTIRLAK